MSVITVIARLISDYKTYASTILAIVSGLGLIFAKNYSAGIEQILQALLVLFSGATVMSMRHDVEKVAAHVKAQLPPPAPAAK